jgi:colicin import membrane protein
MHTADRILFAPPAAPGLLRSVGLALAAHAVLLAALTWGVSWNKGTTLSVEAELWAAVPEEAAAPLRETPPETPVKLKPLTPQLSDADIALTRERERKALEKQVEEKKKKELEAQKLKLAEENKQREKLRQENLQRMAGLAGATGAANSTGTALRSAGPSTSYAGRIRARIKPNIVFTEDIAGNPVAEVEVRTAPDGTIIGSKLLKSSNNKAWDEAVLKAIDKTEILPRDTDGTIYPVLVISFRPKD